MKLIHKAYRFRLKVTPEQEALMAQYVGVCRLIWNLCLEQRMLIYNSSKKSTWGDQQDVEITQLRKEYDFIRQAPSQVLQSVTDNLDKAYKGFFKGNTDFPIYKKKNKSRKSFRYPQGFKIDNRRIFLPKLGWMGFFKSQPIVGKMCHVTVSKHGNYWYASICCEVLIEDQPCADTSIGGDMGVEKLCALSDGTIIENPCSLKRSMKRLANMQRQLSRKMKGGKNYIKLKIKIAILHARIADIRGDNINKSTTIIANSHVMVVLEDLKIKAMSKSAKGTVDQPGKKVKQKSGLNRGILDAGWGEFRRQTGYKLDWRNGILVLVDPKNTSRKCSACGHTAKENRLTQASFVCVKCGYKSDADVNAAVNIQRAGHARLACESSGAVIPPEAGTLELAA